MSRYILENKSSYQDSVAFQLCMSFVEKVDLVFTGAKIAAVQHEMGDGGTINVIALKNKKSIRRVVHDA